MAYSNYLKYQEVIKNFQKSLLPYSNISKSISLSSPFSNRKYIENLKKSFLPYTELAREAQTFRSFQKSLSGYSQLAVQINRDTSFYKSLLQSVPNYNSQFVKLAQQFQASYKPYINSIQSLYDRLTYLAQYSAPLSFGEAYQQIRREFEEIQKEQQSDILTFSEITVKKTEAKVKKAPKGFLSAEFYISLIFSLILLIITQSTANLSEHQISDKIQNLEQIITELPNALMLEHDDSTYYVVVRFVNLRDKPTTKKSKILEVLYPNLKVKLIERKGEWIFIEYYDYVNDLFKRGWVFKKYLKILNPKR